MSDPAAPIDLAHEAIFELGPLTVKPSTREVRRHGEAEVLEPRVMQVLVALHRAEGGVISRDDLTRSCWEGRVVGEDAINRVISRLRRTAEGIGQGAFRIETVTKVGYRLVELTERAGKTAGSSPRPVSGSEVVGIRRASLARPRLIWPVLGGFALAFGGVVSWRLVRSPQAAHPMTVRVVGFRTMSAGLSTALAGTISAEITAAFNADGVIGVSSATAPGTPKTSTYALGGTLYRVDQVIRVITQLSNERTGAILWSDSIDYDAAQRSQIPQRIAVDAGIVVRCGLFGASTYHKLLPDAVLSNYLNYCQSYWAYGGNKTLQFAQRVVAAAPDFSWGWSAVGNGFMQTSMKEEDARRAEELRASGRQAENRALTLDPNNSEALGHKAYLIEPHDWVGQESLFKRAISAKPLDCGCEHYGYGFKLQSVGRLNAAAREFQAAIDMLALWPDSQRALGETLLATGRFDEAKAHFAAAAQLSKTPNFADTIAIALGVETGEYSAAISALRSPQFALPAGTRVSLLTGYEALVSGKAEGKKMAILELLALPRNEQSESVATMLASLGATHEALMVARTRPWLFWRRSMRLVLNDAEFPRVASELGLMTYWKTTHTKPDDCSGKGAPAFCQMIH